MNIKIIVATHKKYWMPDDEMYIPLYVGAAVLEKNNSRQELDFGYVKDNTGDNISVKNANYCELTGLYWAWKNIKADYIGLAHYRRYFSNGKVFTSKRNKIISKTELEERMGNNDILLPIPRNYWIETNYSQYAHAHHAIDLDTTREILEDKYPNYVFAYDKIMKQTIGHRFNMFVMKYARFDEYCSWLFDILFELEKVLDISSYNQNDRRVFGFVSERLLDVWIEANGYCYKDIPYVFIEKQNWFAKYKNFLKRKFLNYTKVF